MIRKILKFIIKTFFILLLILVGGVFYLGETTSGLQTTIALTKRFIPGNLHIDHAEGKLFSDISLVNVSYQTADLTISFDALRFKWHILGLFSSLLDIDKFAVHHLEIRTIALDTDAPSDYQFNTDNLRWLNHIHVKNVLIGKINYFQNQKLLFTAHHLTLQTQNNGDILLGGKTFDGELQAKLNYFWDPQFTWNVALQGQHINPGVLFSDWQGQLNFALETQGNLSYQSFLTKNNAQLKFNLKDLTGTLHNYPLKGNASFEFVNQQLKIAPSKITIADNYIEIGGTLTDQWNLHWQVHIPNMNNVIPAAKGNLASNALITGPYDSPTIKADISSNKLNFYENKVDKLEGKINLTLKPNTPFNLNLLATNLTLQDNKFKKIDIDIDGKILQNEKNYLPSFSIALDDKRYINADLFIPKTIAANNFMQQSFGATVHVHFNDLRQLNTYIPNTKNLAGDIEGQINIDGTLSKPKIEGNIDLRHGAISIPQLGLNLNSINLNLHGDQSQQVNYSGSFKATTGNGTLTGTTDLTTFASDLALKGNNLEVVHVAEYEIKATPDLQIHYKNNNWFIDGKLYIPQASITPKDFRNTVTLPDEIVYVGKKQVPTSPLTILIPTMNISLDLGKNVYLHYQDLETQLGGKLQIMTSAKRPPTATGELFTLDGVYKAYGKTLKITAGRLVYTGGPLTNPGLNIKAERSIIAAETASSAFMSGGRPKKVGLQLTGTLDKPSLSFWAAPSGQSQEDILSYLVFGVPSKERSTTDIALLTAAAASGNTSKVAVLTEKLKKGLGLTDLRFASVQTYDPKGGYNSTQAVVLSKKISKNLSIHYSQALLQPVSILDLRYKFNKHWSVQSETSKIENGVDLMYSIERD